MAALRSLGPPLRLNWADVVYLQARMDDDAARMLVVIVVTSEGRKGPIGFQVGVCENTQSWRELLVGLKAHGLSIAPEIAIGDSALGYWRVLEETFPSTRHQRCWLHKLVNILNKVAKSVQANMKDDLREVRDGITPQRLQRILAHASGTLSPLALVHNRAGYMDEMKEALDAYRAYLDRLASLGQSST